MFRKITTIFIAFFLLVVLSFSFAEENTGKSTQECIACHVSAKPVSEDHALKPCPGLASSTQEESLASSPKMVILGTLENLYVPVQFNHKLHSNMSGMGANCKTCHHYSKASQFTPHACKTCHPKDVIHENIGQPGLKGAYHRQCLGCHLNWDSQASCEICHEKRLGGKLNGKAKTYATISHYKRVELKELIRIRTDFAQDDEVPFTHKRHATMYGKDCAVCHRHESCNSCHSQQKKLHPFANSSKEDIHKTCNKCHGKNECTHCHGRDPKNVEFSHETTGWSLNPIHSRLKCWQCHYKKDSFKRPEPKCSGCHSANWFPSGFKHEITGITLNEIHSQFTCGDCHDKGVGGGSVCASCHGDGRKYDPKNGGGLP